MKKEEALQELRSFIGQLTEGCQDVIKELIPELRESEDERMRQRIIKAIRLRADDMNEEWSDEIAWLEKQNEQKPRKFKLGDKIHWHDDDTNVITITGFRDDAYLTDSAYGPILFCDEDNWERIERKRCIYGDTPSVERCAVCSAKCDIRVREDKQKPEVKLTGWVARDSEYNPYSGLGLILFNEKPRKYYDCWRGAIASQLPWKSFPDLKWEDEPMKVEVTIRKKNAEL